MPILAMNLQRTLVDFFAVLSFLLLASAVNADSSPVYVDLLSAATVAESKIGKEDNVVQSNFFGISFELSFMNEYCK